MSDGPQGWDVETAYDGKTVVNLASPDSASNQRAASATIGNFAVQLAALAGHYAPDVGVTSSAVAKWAKILSRHRIQSLASPTQSVLTN
jgi:hypothetical protein